MTDTEAKQLQDHIREMAIQFNPDYPDVANCAIYEHLHAIEGAYLGLEAANKDLHEFISFLCEWLGRTHEEALREWKARGGSEND